jgi:hypothetical protein
VAQPVGYVAAPLCRRVLKFVLGAHGDRAPWLQGGAKASLAGCSVGYRQWVVVSAVTSGNRKAELMLVVMESGK